MLKKRIGSIMILGGGITGIQASLDLADSGFKVFLVEKNPSIGGSMAQLDKTFPTNDCSMCIISPKLVEAGRHLNIELLTMTEVKSLTGEAGNFRIQLKSKPRFIDIEKCKSCGECVNVCPIDVHNEFDFGLSSKKAIYKIFPQAMPGAYTIEKKGVAPCKAGCPANPNFQGCIALISKKKYKEAFELFCSENPFPGICGRVCHHPCEDACSRSQIDKSVSIMAIHRFLSDWARNNYKNYTPKIKKKRLKKVAIIGSGPAGLSCAYFLSIDGFDVTVYEKNKILGGMLTVGIPSYRLPRKVVEDEIKILKKIGVSFRTETTIGKDLTIDELRKNNYEAFFLAIGAHSGKELNIKNKDLADVMSGVEYLYKINDGKKVNLGDNVAVIGGGNVAIDVVRTAMRTGCKNPFILYRRSINEMPANKEEIEECLDEGINIRSLTQPIEFIIDNGKLVGLKCVKIKLITKFENKRPVPIPIENSEHIINADCVINSIGQEPKWSNLLKKSMCKVGKNGTIKINPKTLQTNEDDIFAGGDSVTGPATVIDAISSGKKAAFYIKKFLLENNLNISTQNFNEEKIAKVNIEKVNKTNTPIEKMSLLSPNERKKTMEKEVQLGFEENQVMNEIKRCLSCGVCSECHECVKICLSEAINHSMKENILEINVGAIIISTGFLPFNPIDSEHYPYKKHSNVLTSIEFERLLSASGPYQGKLLKPSDKKPPMKIAWIQCVGSRDINNCDNGYCSSVCCMYANKQAIVSKEHSKKPIDTVIFYIDMRTFGKDFDKYSDRGQTEYGVRLVKSRIHSVLPINKNQLKIVYFTEFGNSAEEIFDIVVLSVGLSPHYKNKDFSDIFKIDLNSNNFAKTTCLSPVNTNQKGIFVSGAFQSPKDIPSSIIEASASSALASELLSESKWSLSVKRTKPPERNVDNEEPRIGVFICNCGINIGGVINVSSIKQYALSLEKVVFSEECMFACSQDSQDFMKDSILKNNINRVVVASCSPRTHESLFQKTITDIGLNKYLFEMANIRDQNTWVHMNEPLKATQKAIDLIRMSIASVIHNKALHQTKTSIIKRALIIGGGISGIEVSLSIAKQGIEVTLIEKSNKLGGNAEYLYNTWQGELVKEHLNKVIKSVSKMDNVKIYKKSEIIKTTGSVGNFSTLIKSYGNKEEIKHGVTIIATGGEEHKPPEFLYGKNKNVITHLELDCAISNNSEILNCQNIAFIQCVGSRNENRQYCSKVCCTHSIKSALYLKNRNPNNKILILYRDIRSYGFREKLYQRARKKGIIFSRYSLNNVPKVYEESSNSIKLKFFNEILKTSIKFNINLLVLASGIVPSCNEKISQIFKIPINNDGFFVEAHAKLRPVDLSSDGIFLAGLAHSPMPIEESISQAKASASRAMRILSKAYILVGGVIAKIDTGRCAICLTCVRTCPYKTPKVKNHGYAEINQSECHGCGICASECPNKAISLNHFSDLQLNSKAKALFTEN